MKFINKEEVEKVKLPGRIIQKVAGKDGVIKSNKMTIGFACYSAEAGPMEPHHHAEEIVYIIDAKDGWVKYGEKKNELNNKVNLYAGMTLHFDELEWHVFEYGIDGFIDIIFFYGQVENIRPEEINNS